MRVMRTSPTKAIQVGKVPIELRRDKMLLEFWSRLLGCGYENPDKTVIQDCWEYRIYQSNGFGWLQKLNQKNIG